MSVRFGPPVDLFSGKEYDVGRVSGAVGAALVVVALAGCQGDPEPRVQESPSVSATSESESKSPTPSESAVPTPTESGEAVAPAMPAAAGEKSGAGAEAFTSWWVELLNFASTSGDSSGLRAESAGACDGCLALAELIDETYASGGHIEGGRWMIGNLTSLPLDHGADWGGFAEARSEPQKIVSGDGTSKGYVGGTFYFYGYAAWVDGAWRMVWIRTPEKA